MRKRKIKLFTMLLSIMLAVPLVSYASNSSNAVTSNEDETVPEIKEEHNEFYFNKLTTLYELAEGLINSHKKDFIFEDIRPLEKVMDEVLKSIDGNNLTKDLYYLGKKLQNAMDALVVLDKNISEELKRFRGFYNVANKLIADDKKNDLFVNTAELQKILNIAVGYIEGDKKAKDAKEIRDLANKLLEAMQNLEPKKVTPAIVVDKEMAVQFTRLKNFYNLAKYLIEDHNKKDLYKDINKLGKIMNEAYDYVEGKKKPKDANELKELADKLLDAMQNLEPKEVTPAIVVDKEMAVQYTRLKLWYNHALDRINENTKKPTYKDISKLGKLVNEAYDYVVAGKKAKNADELKEIADKLREAVQSLELIDEKPGPKPPVNPNNPIEDNKGGILKDSKTGIAILNKNLHPLRYKLVTEKVVDDNLPKNMDVYSIKLIDLSTKQTITNFEKPLEVFIPSQKEATKVVYLKNGGIVESFKIEKVEGGYTFKTSHLSLYGLVYAKATPDKKDEGSQTDPTPDKKDEGSQTDPTPDKKDEGSQTDPTPDKKDEGSQTDPTPDKKDEGSQTDPTPDKKDEGSQTDPTPDKKDEGLQTDPTPDKKDAETQTDKGDESVDTPSSINNVDNKPEKTPEKELVQTGQSSNAVMYTLILGIVAAALYTISVKIRKNK